MVIIEARQRSSMSVSPVQGRPNLKAQSIAKPSSPKGLAAVPDRLETSPVGNQEGPPSLFKKFLFDPIIQSIKWLLRGLFHFVDWLRSVAFEAEPTEISSDKTRDQTFLSHLRTAPRAQELLVQFERHFTLNERNEIYRSIGEGYAGRISWKERIWKRSAQENINLGRRIVSSNPERIRDRLADRLAVNS